MPRLLIAIPVYNESSILVESVRAVQAWCSRHLQDFDWKIVIADNGSTDDTLRRARQLADGLLHISVFHTDEKGRGQVLRRLWTSRDFDFYTYMDADLSTSLDSFGAIVDALRSGAAVAVGSRFLKSATVQRGAVRETTSRVYNWLVRRLLGLAVQDSQCGAKGVSRRVVDAVVAKTKHCGWFFDTELLVLARRAGFEVREIPVMWVETRFSGRKSTVKLMRTILGFLRDIAVLRWRLWRSH